LPGDEFRRSYAPALPQISRMIKDVIMRDYKT
jgi:hypothetical protein